MKKIPFTSLCQHWGTPRETYDELDREFHFTFDPCPQGFFCDGLKEEWGDSNYVNPPFKDIALWVKKSWEEHQKMKNCNGVAFHFRSTGYFEGGRR